MSVYQQQNMHHNSMRVNHYDPRQGFGLCIAITMSVSKAWVKSVVYHVES